MAGGQTPWLHVGNKTPYRKAIFLIGVGSRKGPSDFSSHLY